MKKAIFPVIVLLAAVFAIAGCESGGKVLAIVNGKKITQQDFDNKIANLNPAIRQVILERKKDFLNEMVLEQLFLDEARKRHIENDPEVKKLFTEAKKKIIIARLMDVEAEKSVDVSAKEIQDFYNTNRDKFQAPRQIRASHIFVDTKEKADEALAKLKKGESFEALAKQYSLDQTKDRGGDIGYFSKGQLIPEFENACESLDVGQVSGVVKTPLGYHIIKVTDIKPARELTLTEVRDAIANQIASEKKKAAIAEFIKKTRGRANIEILEDFTEETKAKQ